ncbi:MAG: hypothetical protein ATN31_01165 [Candidatus Epulonipiscioides saccharophilum]|nr:MAG: hypothetical protein ATN31_01165 [Epulopiscium sp. AS2M-Bin001]
MKKIMGLITVIVLQTAILSAAPIYTSLDVVYNDVKLSMDGESLILKDAYGSVIEPFIIDGMSYVPVEALMKELGKGILWEEQTRTIHIVDNQIESVKKLSDIPKSSFSGREAVYPIIGQITDPVGVEYTDGIIFTGDGDGKTIADIVTYPLNGEYSQLSGTAFLPTALAIVGYVNKNPNSQISGYTNLADIKIYGDGRLLKDIPSLTRADVVNFDLDITGVKELKIEIRAYGSTVFSNIVALTNLSLYSSSH